MDVLKHAMGEVPTTRFILGLINGRRGDVVKNFPLACHRPLKDHRQNVAWYIYAGHVAMLEDGMEEILRKILIINNEIIGERSERDIYRSRKLRFCS